MKLAYGIFFSILIFGINYDQPKPIVQVAGHNSFEYVATWASNGSQFDQLYNPSYIQTNGTHYVISDRGNSRVQIVDLAGNFVDTFGTIGSGAGEFAATGVVYLNGSHILVADVVPFSVNRIQIFDLQGNYVDEFGSNGYGPGQFTLITGIAQNGTHIFVSDQDQNRIQVFDLQGNYITEVMRDNNAALSIIEHGLKLYVPTDFGIDILAPDLSTAYSIDYSTPLGTVMRWAMTDEFIVITREFYIITIIDYDGNIIMEIDNGSGTGPGQFQGIVEPAINETHMAIADFISGRIQVFSYEYFPRLTVTDTQTETSITTETLSEAETTTFTKTEQETTNITQTI